MYMCVCVCICKHICISFEHPTVSVTRLTLASLSSENGTYMAVKARFWPWVSGKWL